MCDNLNGVGWCIKRLVAALRSRNKFQCQKLTPFLAHCRWTITRQKASVSGLKMLWPTDGTIMNSNLLLPLLVIRSIFAPVTSLLTIISTPDLVIVVIQP